MRVILHIGQSKTVTTALQSFLASNRASLVTAGILYPDVYRSGIPLNVLDHNSFAEALCGFRRFPALSAEEYFSQFLKQAKDKKCDTLLLSGESFRGAPQIWPSEPQAHPLDFLYNIDHCGSNRYCPTRIFCGVPSIFS